MNMFTIEGVEVSVVREIEGGYLAKTIYVYYDEDEEQIAESGEIVFYERLFKKAPTEKYALEVERLKDEAVALEENIKELQTQQRNEKSLISKISKFPILQQLSDYLTGDFNFKLMMRGLEEYRKDMTFNSSYIKAIQTKEEPFYLYTLHNDGYESNDDTPFLVFKTKEDMRLKAKDVLIKRLNSYKSTYNRVSNFKEMLSKVAYNTPVAKDKDVLDLYNSKLQVLEEEERQETAAKLKKEISELANKKKQLENLINK